jgi:hypothetical protein
MRLSMPSPKTPDHNPDGMAREGRWEIIALPAETGWGTVPVTLHKAAWPFPSNPTDNSYEKSSFDAS